MTRANQSAYAAHTYIDTLNYHHFESWNNATTLLSVHTHVALPSSKS